jgi:hypothetical protein
VNILKKTKIELSVSILRKSFFFSVKKNMSDKKGGESSGSGGGTGDGSGGSGSGGVGGTKSLMGQMENYILGEDFKMYLDRFNNFLELNNVEVDAYKIQLLTHFVGPVRKL